MKRNFLLILFCFSFILPGEKFKSDQNKYPRVRAAYKNCGATIKTLLASKQITSPFHLFIRGFKEEGILEVWVKQDVKYTLLKSYPICNSSGGPGPKRRYGDLQVPEGVYSINRFNPQSNYHLSLGISYPNRSDKVLSPFSNLGGDIFIHGACVTVGCLPLTDTKIEELYVFAVEARASGQMDIPVHIFPTRMSPDGMTKLLERHKRDLELMVFWENLKLVYESFEKEKKLHTITIDKKGRYVVNSLFKS